MVLTFMGCHIYPPKWQKLLLARRIPGPGGSFIPTKKDELDSIIYHALYHKGYLSRIKSETSINQKNDEDNKYTLAINRLSRDLGLNVGDNSRGVRSFIWLPRDKGQQLTL